MRIGLFEQQMTRIIPSFAGFTEFTTSIPKLYWDVKSQEQRILAICKMLDKVICYADMLGENVDEIAHTMQEILDGKLDPMIVAAIAEWFENNQPQIKTDILALQNVLPITDFDENHTVKDAIDVVGAALPTTDFNADNTVKDAIDALGQVLPIADFDENHTVKDAIDAVNSRAGNIENDLDGIETRTAELEKSNYSEANFRCVNRHIYGNWGIDDINSAQAGCVFEQNGLLYWAQILNSTSANNDHLVITEMASNTIVADLKTQIGHGYTISYNPATKQLLTEDTETTPYKIVIIDVSTITAPSIDTYIVVPNSNIDNPCWYDDSHIIGSTGNNTWGVFDLNLTQTDSYTIDLHGFAYSTGYIFQNICWDAENNSAYIGVTLPDGIIICDVDNENKKITMTDFIAMKPYYGCLYMRELEFAYKYGNKMYINQFDQIDDLLVFSLLEWDMVNGTIPNENSMFVNSRAGDVNFTIDWENGLLIPNSSAGANYKLFGDAVNELRSLGGYSRGYMNFASNYPNVIYAKGCKLSIGTAPGIAQVTVAGMNFSNSDIIWAPSGVIRVQPDNISISSGGNTYHLAMRISLCEFAIQTQNANMPVLYNPNSVSNARRIYIENSNMRALFGVTFDNTDWLRWIVANVAAATNVANATKQGCVVNTAS